MHSRATHGARLVYTGDIGIQRTKQVLRLLGDPQNLLDVIHIAGTSGKGSTAYFIHDILKAHGFRTGLNVSPHIIDLRERFQINGEFVSEDECVMYLNELIPAFEKTGATELGYPTYFEILTVLSYYVLSKKKVAYAVIETGMGGLLDATNVITSPRKLSVLTNIGFDHMNVLGHSLAEIAGHKAGIIQDNSLVVAALPEKEVRQVFDAAARRTESEIRYVTEGEHYRITGSDENSIRFDVNWRGLDIRDITFRAPALFQARNASLAIAAVAELGRRDGFSLSPEAVRAAVAAFKAPGRMEVLQTGRKQIIVDGAHNEQKMSAFISSLAGAFPGEQFDFLLAFKSSKDVEAMARIIRPFARSVTVTSFFHLDKQYRYLSAKPEMVADIFRQMGFPQVSSVSLPEQALERMMKKDGTRLVITGSFYLIGELYGHLKAITS